LLTRDLNRNVWVFFAGGLGFGGCTVIQQVQPDPDGSGGMGGEHAGVGGGGGSLATGGTGGSDDGPTTGGSASGDDEDASGGNSTGGTNWSQVGGSTSWNSLAGASNEGPPEDCEDVEPVAFPLTQNGSVIASDDGLGAASAARVFDFSSGTSWVVAGTPTPWVGYDFHDEKPVATSYELVSGPNSAAENSPEPKSWELQGTNSDEDEDEDAEWVTLDARTDQVFGEAYTVRRYEFDNTTGYRRYRLFVIENGGAPGFELAEFTLFGNGNPVFSIDDFERGTSLNQFTFSPSWVGQTLDPTSERYDGTSSWSNLVGDWAEVRFEGTGIELYAVVDPKHGVMGITLDGQDPTLVDIYSPVTVFDTLAWRSPRVCPGEHVLRIEVTGFRSQDSTDHYVSFDRVVVLP
jgi:hypothetical protein